MSLSLGIDIGTSGIRTAVLNSTGDVVSMARAEHLQQEPGRIDAKKWWRATLTCMARQIEALNEAGYSGRDIRHIAVDGTSGSMVLTDAALQPVTRALMYNSKGFDAEASHIAQHAPASHITRGSNSALARAMRLASEDPEQRGRHLLHQADFIAAKLMGFCGQSDHNNALKTGFDPEKECWPDWIEAVIDPTLLPAAHAIGTPLQTIAAGVAAEIGLSPNAVIHAGTTDSVAAFLAAAPLEAGVAVTSLGSTLAIKLLNDVRIDDPSIGLYSHRIGDIWLAGGASNTGGAVLAHHFSATDLEHLSAQIDPRTTTGLDYYPLLEPGERFPFNDPSHTPILKPRPTSDAEFLQAIFEGIARIEARCYREIEARGGTYPETVLSAGGGANNAVFTAIRAHALGLTPVRADHQEAAIGAARIASGVS